MFQPAPRRLVHISHAKSDESKSYCMYKICTSICGFPSSALANAPELKRNTGGSFSLSSKRFLYFSSATCNSSRIASGMVCASANNSIVTPTATAVMNCNSLRRCIALASLFPSVTGCRNKYHSPIQPIATDAAANTSQPIQNHKGGSTQKPITTNEIVARIPEIIFGILLLFLIRSFWKITFTNHDLKNIIPFVIR